MAGSKTQLTSVGSLSEPRVVPELRAYPNLIEWGSQDHEGLGEVRYDAAFLEAGSVDGEQTVVQDKLHTACYELLGQKDGPALPPRS